MTNKTSTHLPNETPFKVRFQNEPKWYTIWGLSAKEITRKANRKWPHNPVAEIHPAGWDQETGEYIILDEHPDQPFDLVLFTEVNPQDATILVGLIRKQFSDVDPHIRFCKWDNSKPGTIEIYLDKPITPNKRGKVDNFCFGFFRTLEALRSVETK